MCSGFINGPSGPYKNGWSFQLKVMFYWVWESVYEKKSF